MIGHVGKGKQPKPAKGEPEPKKSPPPPPEKDDLYDAGDICAPEPERDDEALM